MPRSKTKNKTIKPIYPKLFGFIWLIFFVLLLSKVNALKLFGSMFFGGANCSSCTQVGLLSLGLSFLIFAVGAASLAYGVIVSEVKPDFRVSRLVTLACAIAAASLIVFGWINFIINY